MTLAVLMAGGEGTRLRPLTVSKPKPLVRVLNIPVLTYSLIRIRRLGFKHAKVTLCYLPTSITNLYGDGSGLGMSLEYSIEERPLGTAGGVREAVGEASERTLVISGDLITDINLKEMLDFHVKKGALMTIALSFSEEPYQFGIAKLDGEGRITRYLEKPSPTEVFSKYINAGIYVLEPEVFRYIPKSSEFDFSRDLIPILLSKNEPIHGFYSNAYWRDIGTIEQYLQCNHELLQGFSKELLEIALSNQAVAEDLPNVEGKCLINAKAKVSKNAKIGHLTVIDEDVAIEDNCIINASIISKGAYIGERSSITRSVIDMYASIKGKAVIFENCVIGERTVIGRGVEIRPNVRIWPDKVIEDNVVVSSNVVTAARTLRPLFNMGLASFTINVDMSPEVAARFGRAVANAHQTRQKIAVASSSKQIFRLLMNPMIAGIISSCCDVLDLGIIPSPLARLGCRRASSCIYASMNERVQGDILVQIFDEKGINISEREEKKIENLFYREEFRFARLEDLGEIIEIDEEDLIKEYFDSIPKNIIEDLELNFISKNKFMKIFEELEKRGARVNLYNNVNTILKNNKFIIKFNDDFSRIDLIDSKGIVLNAGKTILIELISAKEILGSSSLILPYYICDEIIDYLKSYGFKINLIFPSPREYSRSLLSGDLMIADPLYGLAFSSTRSFDGILCSILVSKTSLKNVPEHFVMLEEELLPQNLIYKVIDRLKGSEGFKVVGNGLLIEEEKSKCMIYPSPLIQGLDIVASGVSFEKTLKLVNLAKKLINKLKSNFLT